jgi:hypothetical protein
MRVLARGEVLRLSSGELRGAEMGKWSMPTDAGLLVSAGLVAGTAHAQADAIAMPPPVPETMAVLRLAATL